jgi:hypothetical protein
MRSLRSTANFAAENGVPLSGSKGTALTLTFAGALYGVIAPTIGACRRVHSPDGHCSGIFRQLMFCDKSRRGQACTM